MTKRNIINRVVGKLISLPPICALLFVASAHILSVTDARAQNGCAPKVVPGRIEAECYDQAASVQLEPTGDEGGGTNVGYISDSSYLQYNVSVPRRGNYSLNLRVASPNGAPGAVLFQVISPGRNRQTVFNLPATGGWQSWTTVIKNVRLDAGAQRVRLTALGGGWNINWLEFGDAKPWLDTNLSADQRASLLVSAMTFDEKIRFVSGLGSANRYRRIGIARLGVPPYIAKDGPIGVTAPLPATAFPAGLSLASTFDPNLARQQGAIIGRETYHYGYSASAGPTVDLARVANYGRNYETFGEDPILTGRFGAAQVQGIQTSPILAFVKHYNLNNQETQRLVINEIVDERTLQEIYTLPWESIVKIGEPGSIMCGFNLVNNKFSCGSDELLNGILKTQLGFKGYVSTDFNAARSTLDANAGLDSEDPDAIYFGDRLRQAVLSGAVSQARLDNMNFRILRSYIQVGYFDNPPPGIFTNPAVQTELPNNVLNRHNETAREIAVKGMVLLKNSNNALPLSTNNLNSIAVIGADADYNIAGGGAAFVPFPARLVTAPEGIQARAGSNVQIRYADGTDPLSAGDMLPGLPPVPSSVLTPPAGFGISGLRAEYFLNPVFAGNPNFARPEPQVNRVSGVVDFTNASQTAELPFPFNFAPISIRYTGTLTAPATGSYTLSLFHWGTARLIVDGQTLIDDPGTTPTTTSTTVNLEAGRQYQIRIEYAADTVEQATTPAYTQGGLARIRFGWTTPDNVLPPNIQAAVSAAAQSDVAIVVARDFSNESLDRANLTLPQDQDRLIRAVAAANPRTIVVLATGGPVLMPWLDSVPAVLETWYPGQAQGNAIADVLFGDQNPSGKLPVSFPRSEAEQPVRTVEQFPGVGNVATYTEGLFMGYRGYDGFGITPQFEFGYGLSYTTFSYSDLRITPSARRGDQSLRVRFRVTNTGARAGAETPQVYVALPSNLNEPPKRLVGFEKVTLAAGQSQTVEITIDPNSPEHPLSYWDVNADRWITARGNYRFFVGASSRDLPLTEIVRFR